ncbi:MAG: ABC transporter permease [Anaerocolumna sp.]
MSLLQIIRICFKNVMLNKFRSFLTMLGLVIGVSSVIILTGITEGSNEDIDTSLEGLGADIVEVQVYSGSDETLTYDDISDLKISLAEDMVAVSQSRSSVRNESTTGNYQIIGTEPNYIDIQQLSLNSGRNISGLDVENASNVAVIGSDAASDLFSMEDPVGQKVLINSNFYTVIGVLSDGDSSTSDTGSSVIIPISSSKRTSGSDEVSSLYFQAQNTNEMSLKMLQNNIESELGKIISTDNFEIVTQDSSSQTISEVSSTMELMITVIGAIALVVSGIGVMNIMLVSVTERTREIGVRKAIGATNFNILGQFLIEAFVLSTTGGLIGFGFSTLAKQVLEILSISYVIDMNTVWLSLAFSSLIGIVFGIIPAIRASRLRPVDALKYE